MNSLTVVVLFYFTITVCPVGWVYGRTKCFLIVNPPPNDDWTSARDYCNGLDAVAMGNGEMVEPSLLFIESVEEYSLLQATRERRLALDELRKCRGDMDLLHGQSKYHK